MRLTDFTERTLSDLWKHCVAGPPALNTAGGQWVYVIYQGRENRDRGPDFNGAMICMRGTGLVRGDVELHTSAGDWTAHGHHHDIHYNNVVLHVVWAGDESIVLQNGTVVPTLNMRRQLPCLLKKDCSSRVTRNVGCVEVCRDAFKKLDDIELGFLLDEAGDKRFRTKVDCFKADMCRYQPSQLLYRGIMGALGYAKNRYTFEALADRLPLQVLEKACGRGPGCNPVHASKGGGLVNFR